MNIILDTNVFISGVFFSGPPHRILQAWRDGMIQLVVSPAILAEYHRVGNELLRQFPVIELGPWLELVTRSAIVVYAPSLRSRFAVMPMMTCFCHVRWPAGQSGLLQATRHCLLCCDSATLPL